MFKKNILFTFILLLFTSASLAQDSIDIADFYDGLGSAYIVLKMDGIDGDSVIFNHENEITALTWQWGASQNGSMHVGGGGGAGRSNVENLVITKYVDRATPGLLLTCLTGSHVNEAVLTVGTKGEENFDYLRITMSPVIVTSVISNGGEDFGLASERVSLNFGKVKFEYITRLPDGSAGPSIEFTWNIEMNRQE